MRSPVDSGRRRLLSSGLMALAWGGAATSLLPSLARADGGRSRLPLSPVADGATGRELLRLPEGFRYFSFGWAGDRLAGGGKVPASADGMGVISQEGQRVRLIRNQELNLITGPFAPGESGCYDPLCGGGTVTMELDLESESLVSVDASLTGTLLNCAGGVTPWGSWMSCEEIVHINGHALGGAPDHDQMRDHGFVFEVPSDGRSSAQPLKEMGLFRHEAVAIDPDSGVAYLTEDQYTQAGFYRFVPKTKGKLADGGQLQMLVAKGYPDLRREAPRNQTIDVDWVSIDDPGAGRLNDDDRIGIGISQQGIDRGATRFTRLEGCAYRDGRIYFTSTDGGNAAAGQVFMLDIKQSQLSLIYEIGAEERPDFDYPDNITPAPGGGLIICEDSALRGPGRGQALYWLSPKGQPVQLAINQVKLGGRDLSGAEWAGCCFSRDGKWLFANIYTPGFSVAITGPWESLWRSA